MLIRVKKRCQGDKLALVDWTMLDKYWHLDDIKPPNRMALFDKYLWLWLSTDAEGVWFEVPEIGWSPVLGSISFSNGRNRTALITKHQALMPVAIDDEILIVPEFRAAMIREISEGDYVEIPDLPVITYEQLFQR